MNKLLSSLAAAALLTGALSVQAQQKVNSSGGNSPHETTSAVIDGNNRVTITYGRPYTKHPKTGEVRKIWGGLVPYGKAWRLGSDEATLLVTQLPIMIGSVEVPAGAHTLYLVPEESGAKLAISNKLGGWGIPVDEKNDLGRVDLTKGSPAAAVDQFTMGVMKNPSGAGGVIKMSWENTEYSIPFTTKK